MSEIQIKTIVCGVKPKGYFPSCTASNNAPFSSAVMSDHSFGVLPRGGRQYLPSSILSTILVSDLQLLVSVADFRDFAVDQKRPVLSLVVARSYNSSDRDTEITLSVWMHVYDHVNLH